MVAHSTKPRFGTLLTAMVTPFTNEGTVDLATARKLAKKLVDDGCDGLVVTGTTGEIPTLTDDENVAMFEAVLEEVGDRAAVIAGTGMNATAHSINLSRRAQEVGVDGILLVTPYYNKPSQAGVKAHMLAIAEATDVPIMLYDIPGRTGIPMSTETIVELAQHERIVALKDAKGNLLETSRVIASTDLDVYSGDDGVTLPLMSIGAVGLVSVTAHIATAKYRQLVDAANAGDLATARRLHHELDPIQRACMTHIQGAVAAKSILHWQGALPNSVVRLPLVEATAEELEPVHADLREAGWEI